MRTNKNYGIVDNISREFFSFTAWGRNVTKEDVNILFDKGTITPNGHKIIEKV
jgi:hypothetical protein